MPAPGPGRLLGVLEQARERGFLGPGPVERQHDHALDLARAIGPFAGRLLDLGSGGGLPGLVLFATWPDAQGVMLDAQQRRCAFLIEAVSSLALTERVEVACGRAEDLARSAALRASFDLVVARAFGPPAVTAECAVGFLRPGGALVVTEPPEADDHGDVEGRWDRPGLESLGFGAPTRIRSGTTGAVRIPLKAAADERWPRRNGMPAKRPLW